MNTYFRCFLYCFVAFVASIVLLSNASAYDCTGVSWWLQLEEGTGGFGTTLVDVCDGNDFTRQTTTEQVAGLWIYGQRFKLADSDYASMSNMSSLVTGSRSWRAVYKPASTATAQWLVGDNAATLNGANLDLYAYPLFHCLCGTGAAFIDATSTTSAVVGNWYDVVCVYDDAATNLSVYVNGVYEDSAIGACNQNAGANLLLGKYNAPAFPADGVIDEVFYVDDRALNDSEIANLSANNNFTTSGGASPGSIGCSFASIAPPNAFAVSDSTPLFSATLTCYNSMATRCDLYMNSTASGFNSSLSNGTVFEVTANSSKADATYSWYFSCSNGTVTNNSVTRSLLIDTNGPDIFIYSPTNTTYTTPYTAILDLIWANETHPDTCYYSLDGAPSVVIGYTNGTSLTSAVGSYHVELWCNDTAGNFKSDSVYFTLAAPVVHLPECTADTVFWVTANEDTGNLTISCPSTAMTQAVKLGTPSSVAGEWANATSGNRRPPIDGDAWLLDAYNLTGTQATVTAWIYTKGTNGVVGVPYMGVVDKTSDDGGAETALGIMVLNAAPTTVLYCDVGSNAINMNLSMGWNAWYFVGCRTNGTHVFGWVNGSNASIPYVFTGYNSSIGSYALINFGNYYSAGPGYLLYSFAYYGQVDEATLWKRALTDVEINNLRAYNNISGIAPIPPPIANCSSGVCGYVIDCGNQSGLEGVSVKVTQNNATDNLDYTTTTNASGYFEIASIQKYLTSRLSFSKEPDYKNIIETFVLTDTSPSRDMSICLVLLRQASIRINTQWSLSSNITGGIARIDTWSDWRPNMTSKKDAIISSIDIWVEDTTTNEGISGIALSTSSVSTTCSFSTAPTAYYIIEKGGGFYYLQAEIGGTNYTNLYAYCGDGAFFDIYYRSAGIDAHGRLDFISYEMRLTNVNVLIDTLPTYSWAYAFGDFYYETGDNKNIPVENLSCQMRLEQTNGSNITVWETATITTTGSEQASHNFTFLSAFPTTLMVHFICNATGFTNFEKQVTVQVGTDAMTVAFCYITDANGLKQDWNKVGAQVRHWCEFKSYKNASLISMQVKAKETASSTERILKYSYDSANIWFFATDLFNDDMAKGLHEWRVTLYNTPSGVKQPNITYYQFVKVYFTPPEKVSADYCDDSNCPKVMYRGTNYVCKLTTKFEAEYTKIIMGVKLNDSTSLISLTPTDNFNPTTQIHETVITIPSVGEGVYGIKAPTKIQCYAELYIDQEHLIYGATPTQMVTQYKHEFESDVFGLQKFLNEFTQSDNPMETGVAKIAGIPAWFFSKIAVTDENGNLNPVLAIMYLIAFALIIALVIVFVNTRQQGGGKGGGAGKYGRPQGYLRIGGKRY